MEFLANTDGTHETLETLRRPCELIILSIGHFDTLKEPLDDVILHSGKCSDIHMAL